MSAFLVDKITINRIITLIDRKQRKSEWFRRELEEQFLIDFSDGEWRTSLGQKMPDLNQLALGYRYGDGKLVLSYLYVESPWEISEIQMFKSLQCWLY